MAVMLAYQHCQECSTCPLNEQQHVLEPAVAVLLNHLCLLWHATAALTVAFPLQICCRYSVQHRLQAAAVEIQAEWGQTPVLPQVSNDSVI